MRRIFYVWPITLVLALTALPCAVGPLVDLKITKAEQDMASFATALDIYKAKRGALPTEAEGLAALIGMSIKRVSVDPWGRAYMYRRSAGIEGYRLYSRGLDGKDDGGAGDDVITTSKTYRCEDYGVNCFPTPRDIAVLSLAFVALTSLAVGVVQIGLALRGWLWR